MGFGHTACFFPQPIEELFRCAYHSAQEPTYTLFYKTWCTERFGAIQGGGVGGCQISLKKSVTKIYGSTLLALREGG